MKDTTYFEDTADLADLRRDQRQREMAARYKCSSPTEANKRFERQAIKRLIARLKDFGLNVSQTTHNAHFDLWVGNCRVEFKAARWHKRKSGGRYQANMRGNQADLVVFTAVNGTDHDFIIPHQAIGGRKTLEITSYDVTAYGGQWSPYLGNYDSIIDAAAAEPTTPKQLELEVLQ